MWIVSLSQTVIPDKIPIKQKSGCLTDTVRQPLCIFWEKSKEDLWISYRSLMDKTGETWYAPSIGSLGGYAAC